jgi:hypothetical protein
MGFLKMMVPRCLGKCEKERKKFSMIRIETNLGGNACRYPKFVTALYE